MDDGRSQPACHLTIWGRMNSYNVQKVVWAAEELGLAYQRIDAGRGYGVVDTADFLAMNPNGRVPVIRDGDFVLWESNVIVRHLCSRYGPGNLCPVEHQVRMEAEKWMDWEASGAHRDFLPAYKVFNRREDNFSVSEADAAIMKTRMNFEILNIHLEHNGYTSGDEFSMGDIPVGLLANYFLNSGREVAGLSHVKRWHAALTKRPAMRQVMAAEWSNGS